MSSGNSTGLVTALTATAGLVAAVLGIVKYFNYRTKRDRIAAVGTAFEAVVEALASDDAVKRMAAAIRLRRFFDPRGNWRPAGSGRSFASSELVKDTRPSRLRTRTRQQARQRARRATATGSGSSPATNSPMRPTRSTSLWPSCASSRPATSRSSSPTR